MTGLWYRMKVAQVQDDNEKEKEREKKNQIRPKEMADSKDSWLLPRRPSCSRSGENKVKGREGREVTDFTLLKIYRNRPLIGSQFRGPRSVRFIPRSSALFLLYSTVLLLYDRTLENQNGLSFFSARAVASPSSNFIHSYPLNSNLFHRPNGRDRRLSVI
jgi:hypothetical protein